MIDKHHMKSMYDLFGKGSLFTLSMAEERQYNTAMWAVIESFSWAENCNENYTQIQRAMLEFFDFDILMAASKFAHERMGELYALNCAVNLGGDSLDDCIAHAVGLGETYFNKVKCNPAMLNHLQYRESFKYVLLHEDEDDEEKFTLHYHQQKAYTLWGQLEFHKEKLRDEHGGDWAKVAVRFDDVLLAIGEGNKNMDALWNAVGDLRERDVYSRLGAIGYRYPNALKDMAEYLFDWEKTRDTQLTLDI